MATGDDVCYVTTDGLTIESIHFSKNTTVDEFCEYLLYLAKVDSLSRIRLYDYKGDRVHPSHFPLLPNTTETAYFLQVLPENAAEFPDVSVSDDIEMDLIALEDRIAEIEELVSKDSSSNSDYLQNLKKEFQKFRSKLENGNFVKRINASNLVSPAHRKLKYRRLSDAKQKQVRENFLNICSQSLSDEVLQCLRFPAFDCTLWSDEELLVIVQHMFLHFDFPTRFNINLTTLRTFLFQVYKNYNEVPFHNFRHSFCVTQMMFAMVVKVDLIKYIGDLEILVLLTSCICHDLDHPGYNNIYQINARTELAVRYNDISPLENHHCSMTFRILDLPECNIFENCDPEIFKIAREGIIRCILATDMSRHNEILAQFRDALDEGFDFNNKLHVNLLCMVLIKVADISNEARPMDVAEPWLDKLFKEFFSQSDAEKQLGLPVTPFMDRDKITKPSSQCSFIGFVLLPLFEALGQLFPELDELIVEPVRFALDYYRKLNDAAKDEQRLQRKSVVTLDASSAVNSPTSPGMMTTLQSHLEQTARISQQKSEDASIFSEEGVRSIDYESEEEVDEETVTEVAVSEKALKFKISTESSGLRSHPGSRKGSREKAQDLEMARAYRYERSNRASESGVDKRSWSSSENTSSYEDRRSDNSHEKKILGFSPTTAIPEGSVELPTALANEQTMNVKKEEPSKSSRSPDLKRLMNRVVRDFRGVGSSKKVANGVKNAEDSASTKSDCKGQPNTSRTQPKEPKSPNWMASLLQNIKSRGSSHDSESRS